MFIFAVRNFYLTQYGFFIQPPVQWVPGLSRRLRAAGAWRWPLTPF